MDRLKAPPSYPRLCRPRSQRKRSSPHRRSNPHLDVLSLATPTNDTTPTCHTPQNFPPPPPPPPPSSGQPPIGPDISIMDRLKAPPSYPLSLSSKEAEEKILTPATFKSPFGCTLRCTPTHPRYHTHHATHDTEHPGDHTPCPFCLRQNPTSPPPKAAITPQAKTPCYFGVRCWRSIWKPSPKCPS
eukprot:GHVO01019806.1.p1 GENE.GHVO01019806.1~~GHVO01019806.1.p1  ORF type:complete len:186 (-),score=26.78 GHVO01019806.1:9-566(-)